MTNSDNPLISIIIINYNQIGVTCEFLDSTKLLTYPNYEIILVDNASNVDPTEHVSKNYPEVIIIRPNKNLGFTGGNNIGIERAKGDYVFVVNNDTEVTPNLLEKLLEPFQKDKTIGMVSPKIRFFQNKNVIQYAGFNEINAYTGRNSAVGSKEEDNGQHDRPYFTYYAHGAAMLVSREVLDKVGMFYDPFFIYYEELDWSARTRKAGYNIYYQPAALIYHKESITMGKESPMKAYYHDRNRVLFMRRNYSGFQLFVFLMFFTFLVVPKKIVSYVMKKQKEHLNNFIKGIVWNLKTPANQR